ncbi:beta strand repeat-containing protein, partial [Methanobrevibacter cuticularis]|uniref:beta strand repeat-containing protein n=1 Tax=Methanobrevibacter cuticularis TaxID=47311 RepID=UPI000A5C7F7B
MNKFKKTSFVMILLLLFALFAMVGLSNSFAADHNITNTTNGGIIGAVNSSMANDKITLSDGVYSGNNNKDIIINKNLTITGSNKVNTVIDLGGDSKLFTINSGVRLTLSNLTIKNAIIGNNSYLINNNGYITIENCVITDNILSFNILYNVTYTNNDVLNDGSFESGYLVGNNGQMNIIDSAFINNNMNINYQYYQNVPYTNTTTLYFNNTIYNNSVVGSGFIVNKGRLNIARSEFTDNTIKTTTNRQFNWNNDQNIIINICNPNDELVIGEQTTSYVYAMIVNTGDLVITQSNFKNNINNYNETRNYNKNTTITTNGGTGKKTTAVGIYNLLYSTSNLEVNNSNFINNSYNATYINNNPNYSILYVNGPTIFVTTLANRTVSVNILNSTFVNSTANGDGGGLYVTSSANGNVSVNIVNSSFVNNKGASGGGVVVSSGTSGTTIVNIVNSTFINNTAINGGGVYVNSGIDGTVSVDILNSIFTNNTASFMAGGVTVTSGANGTVSVDIVNSTFVNSTATDAKAIYVTSGTSGTVSVGIVNSTFVNSTANTGNGGGISINAGTNGTVSVGIVNSTFANNKVSSGGGVYVSNSGTNGNVSVNIVNSSFVNSTATNGGAIYVAGSGNVTVGIDNSTFTNNSAYMGGAIYVTGSSNVTVGIINSTFTNNSVSYLGGGVTVTSSANGNVSVDILSSTFVNNAASNGKAILVTNGTNGNVSVVVNYNAFLNQSTSTIYKASTSSAVVDADYNYWGFNGVPTGMSNVVVNSYYVLGITNMSDLSADYTVGDPLSFNYTMYLNGTSDSTNASNLPSLNSIFYNDLLYGYFSLNAPGIIEVPVQTVAGGVFNFTNANGTVIGNFTLIGTIFPGSVSNITVPEIIIVNNTSVDLVISIPTSVGGLAGQTFNVIINGHSQIVTFTNGTGTFVGYQYGNLGLNSLNITLSDNPNYNNSSAINNVFFKE